MKDETMPPLPYEVSEKARVPSFKRIQHLFHEYARAYAAQTVVSEREACAQICEEIHDRNWAAYKRSDGEQRGDVYTEGKADGADECAEAIRARGKP